MSNERCAFDTAKEVYDKKGMLEWKKLTIKIINEKSLLSKDVKNITNLGKLPL